MTWGALGVNLAAMAAAVIALMLATFAYAMRTGVHAIVDTVWGLGFALIALCTYFLSAGHGTSTQRLLVLALTAAWAVRLGVHLFTRNRGHGEDPRYAEILRQGGGPVAFRALRAIYGPQGAIMWVVSLPVQFAMYDRHGPAAVAWIGAAVWAAGFAFEVVGDWQLRRFKADASKRDAVLDTGLWRYTRHPNYFGDSVVWCGLFLIACSSPAGLLTVVSPALMTLFLLKYSGKALLERGLHRSKGAAYDDYVARTSGFIPRPPSRRAAGSGP